MKPLSVGVVAVCTAAALCTTPAAVAAPARTDGPTTVFSGQKGGLSAADRVTLRRYAADTWRSMVALVDLRTGLAADNMRDSLDPATRSR